MMMTDDVSGLEISRAEIATITLNPSAAQAVENLFELAKQTPEAVNDATETAEDAQTTANALAALGYVLLAASGTAPNGRVLTGSTGVTIDTATLGLVKILVNVITALGYTPANKAGDTFTGSVNFPGGLSVGNVAPTGLFSNGVDVALRALATGGLFIQTAAGSVTNMILTSTGINMYLPVDINASLQCDSLRIDQTATASATASTHSIPISINGTTYYMRLSATP